MKHIFTLTLLALIVLSSLTFSQTDTTKTDSTATVFTPPTRAEIDSIREIMDAKDLVEAATVGDILNMYLILKYGDMAEAKRENRAWTKRQYVELPTVNKRGWAANWSAKYDRDRADAAQLETMVDRHDQNLTDLATITMNTRDSLNSYNAQQTAARRDQKNEVNLIKTRLADVELASVDEDELDDRYGQNGIKHQKAAQTRIMERVAQWALEIKLAQR